jgi:hypothetical protein
VRSRPHRGSSQRGVRPNCGPSVATRTLVGPRRPTWGVPALSSVLLGLLGCSATEGLTVQPVVIRSGPGSLGGNRDAIARYYQTIFATMRDALRGGTRDSLAELRYLVQLHKKDEMVPFAREQIERFELLADGLEFELGLGELCEISLRTEKPATTTKQEFRFRMSGSPEHAIVLGGGDEDGVAFRVFVKMRDFAATGQFVETGHNLTLKVPDEHDLAGGKRLEIPFEVPGATPATTIREMLITVEMLPGVVRVDGRRLPVSQMARKRLSRSEVDRLPEAERLARGPSGYARCATYKALLYPEGYESIEKKPLVTLLEAIRRGDAKLFRHVFLATHFMPEKDREMATSRLIIWVRSGTGEQARVAMGCLRIMLRVDRSVTDRDAWLLWWNSRKPK